MYFMPCFYCNVSDAWLFREKSKRLCVTFAGGYCDLCLWALAVVLWRLTLLNGLVNYFAWVALSVLGARTFFNFNPLLKLDGYYLVSDFLEIPNLRQRSWDAVAGHLRWLLWGAPRPAREDRRRFLLAFGLSSWLYSFVFLAFMLWAFLQWLWPSWGWIGVGAVLFLGWASMRGMFRGLFAGEVRKMIRKRPMRTAAWLGFLAALTAACCLIEIEDRSAGPFQVRSVLRAEVRAELAGFLKQVYFDAGDRVSPRATIARLEVPELDSKIAQKQAAIRAAEAKLRLLEIGPRVEEIVEQRRRVERMKVWKDLAEKDLAHSRQALVEDLARLDKQIVQHRAERDSAELNFTRVRGLRATGAMADQDYEEAKRKHEVIQAMLAQAESQKRHREALGTREAIAGLDAEAELARREKDLADAQATLNLLEAGSRPEEIDAGRAHLACLKEEARYLLALKDKLEVTSPLSGLIMTPHLKDRVGQHLREGELICLVEEPAALEVEITIQEHEVARIQPGQTVELKARALPFETFTSRVVRVAPAADPGEVQSTVTVYCQLDGSRAEFRPGMSGHARICCGPRPIAQIMVDRALRFLRTEFWW